jgi:Ca2+/Na+ antiporter
MAVRRKVKFWLLLLLGICIFMPFIILSIIVQLFLYALTFLASFTMYCLFLYRFVHKGKKPKYPVVPPEGRTDIYFPRTDIPRPIHEDTRRYPKFFKIEKKRRYKRKEMEKKRRN